ncbi:MAG: HD domain-containing protein [Magnetococcales bacterium]|nr:HD domain-containing protein [Magnetococcales bacterium]
MTRKVFRDAIHDMISLDREHASPAHDPVEWGDALILDLIDAPPMQRLRRIRQLGTASRVYPTAEHSRFSHALGVMHLAKRILHILGRQESGPIDRVAALQVKVAALLHDVGHGPYSHLFEIIFGAAVNHEALGWRIVAEPGSVRSIISRHCCRLGLDEETFFHGLRAVWGKDGRLHPQEARHFGRQVISSQLDADRMDYVLRDAYFTGVAYGRYDLEWLLHSLRLCTVAGSPRLCVDITRGPTALESYIAARDNMYRQVYHHKTIRAMDSLLMHLFAVLVWGRELLGEYPPGTPSELVRFLDAVRQPGAQPLPLDLFLALDDAVVDYAVNHWAEHLPETPLPWGELRWKSRLFRDRKPLYRRLYWCTVDPRDSGQTIRSDVIQSPEAAHALERFFRAHDNTALPVEWPEGGAPRQIPLRFLVRVDSVERTPYAHLQYAADLQDPVFVLDGSSQAVAAEDASTHISFYGHNRRRLVRVFVDPRGDHAVASLLKRDFCHPDLVVEVPRE